MTRLASLLLAPPVLCLAACADSGPAPRPDDARLEDATPADAPLSDAAGSDDATPPELARDPVQPGPFRVGYRVFPHRYTPPGLPERTIDVHLWYPTEATSAASHAVYEGFLPDEASLLDAPLAPPLHPALGYPVHAYSHGDLGFAGTSAFLMRHFASHGWVAVAPDHTGNTLTDQLDPRPPAIYHLRPSDVSAALDALDALPTDDPLAGRLALDRVLLSGHSFGVHTCWAAAGATFDLSATEATLGALDPTDRAAFEAGRHDPRVVAAIPMAGSIKRGLFGDAGHASVTIPLLALTGTDDPVGADAQFETTAGLDLTWVEVTGACHQAFALGGCSELDDAEGFGLISGLSLAFARWHVLGDRTPATLGLLDGTRPLSARLTYRRHTP